MWSLLDIYRQDRVIRCISSISLFRRGFKLTFIFFHDYCLHLLDLSLTYNSLQIITDLVKLLVNCLFWWLNFGLSQTTLFQRLLYFGWDLKLIVFAGFQSWYPFWLASFVCLAYGNVSFTLYLRGSLSKWALYVYF